jgi:hypothetical protein
MAKHEEIDLFPGERRLVYLIDGSPVLEAEAWCGPPTEHPAVGDEPFGAGPTDPGTFVISGSERHSTAKWKWSRVRWGSRLRPNPKDIEDLLWEDSPGHWRSVKKVTGLRRANVAHRFFNLYGEWRVPETWLFNDFGPIAIRYFKDLNHDGRLDGREGLSGEMFHTTPDNEAETAKFLKANPGKTSDDAPVTMYESHGCIHLSPAQRDAFINAGAFKSGMKLVIHSYAERFRP